MNIKDIWQKMVGNENIRKYAANNENNTLLEDYMKPARTLNDTELNLLLLYVNTRKYAERDRCMLLMTYFAGMRIGEVAATKIKDVLASDGTIKQEINLTAEQTKGKFARTVVLNEKLRKELLAYLLTRLSKQDLITIQYSPIKEKPLFSTQKSEGFNANTACYHFHMLYKRAGLEGCSSHSGRRSFLTELSSKSVPLKVLMELAGHRQAQTTMRYVNVTQDMKRAAVELI